MPSCQDIQDIVNKATLMKGQLNSLIQWLSKTDWGSDISWGGVEGHLQSMEETITKIRERKWGG